MTNVKRDRRCGAVGVWLVVVVVVAAAAAADDEREKGTALTVAIIWRCGVRTTK